MVRKVSTQQDIKLNELIANITLLKKKLERLEIWADVTPQREKRTRKNRNPGFYIQVVCEPQDVMRVQKKWRGVPIKVIASRVSMQKSWFVGAEGSIAEGNEGLHLPASYVQKEKAKIAAEYARKTGRNMIQVPEPRSAGLEIPSSSGSRAASPSSSRAGSLLNEMSEFL